MTTLEDLEPQVREVLEAARDALGKIEMEVREHGERRELMESSRLLAQYCMHAREFLWSIQARRPMPQRFAQRVADLRDGLAPHADAISGLGLRPTRQDLDRLVQAAQTVPGTG